MSVVLLDVVTGWYIFPTPLLHVLGPGRSSTRAHHVFQIWETSWFERGRLGCMTLVAPRARAADRREPCFLVARRVRCSVAPRCTWQGRSI